MALDKAALLAASKKPPKMEEVDVPELGGTVFVKVMSGRERDRWEEIQNKSKFTQFRARIALATLCNADGSPMFVEADLPDIGELPATALDLIFDVARRINGLTPEDVEAVRKNSQKTDGDSKPSVFLDGSARLAESS